VIWPEIEKSPLITWGLDMPLSPGALVAFRGIVSVNWDAVPGWTPPRLIAMFGYTYGMSEPAAGDTGAEAPAFVQNRCFARVGWDRRVRAFCSERRIVYQGFSLLTANPEVMAHAEVHRMAQRHGRTIAQIVFRFAIEIGMVALTGTTNAEHVRADLDIFDFRLSPEEAMDADGRRLEVTEARIRGKPVAVKRKR